MTTMPAARVLICDDHDRIRGVIAALLTDEGYDVAETSTVVEALEELARTPHDAIVLDLHLRGESGLLLIERVRADAALASTPIVLLSGDFESADPREAARYGVEAVLPKPFDPELLSETMSRVLGARAPEAPRDRE